MHRSILAALLLTACLPGVTPTPAQGEATLEVRAVAGPVCPVERDPPDPECEPRPVDGAPLFVSSSDGRDILVAQGTTGADGVARMSLPPGDYIGGGGDVEGLMGRPDPVTVTVVDGQTTILTLTYDTGIR